jgi:hypothetical protein
MVDVKPVRLWAGAWLRALARPVYYGMLSGSRDEGGVKPDIGYDDDTGGPVENMNGGTAGCGGKL